MMRILIVAVAFSIVAGTTMAAHRLCPKVETIPGEWYCHAYDQDGNNCVYSHAAFLDGDYTATQDCHDANCMVCPAHPPMAASATEPVAEERARGTLKASYPGEILHFGEFRFPERSAAQVLNHSLQLISLPSGGTEFVDLITFKFSIDATNTNFETAYMAYEVRDPNPLVPTDLTAVEATPVPGMPNAFNAEFAGIDTPVPVRLHRD